MKVISWIRETLLKNQSSHGRLASIDPDDSDDVDPYDPFPEPVTIEITDVIDLHTIPPSEVKRVVEEYLQEVKAKNFQSVRIIHGKGVGVQREIVRSVLARTPFVSEWMDAPPDAGGLGATIVRLSESTESTDYVDYDK